MKSFTTLSTLTLLCSVVLVCQACTSEPWIEPMCLGHGRDNDKHSCNSNSNNGKGDATGPDHGPSSDCFYETQELLTDPADGSEPETILLDMVPSPASQPSCAQPNEYNVYLDPSQVFAEVPFCSLDSFAYYLRTTFVIIWKMFFYWIHYAYAGAWNRIYFQWRLFWITRESVYWFGEEQSHGEGWIAPPDLIEIDWWTWRATDGDMEKSEKQRVLRPSPLSLIRPRNCTASAALRRRPSRCCKPLANTHHNTSSPLHLGNATTPSAPLLSSQHPIARRPPQASPSLTEGPKVTAFNIPQ